MVAHQATACTNGCAVVVEEDTGIVKETAEPAALTTDPGLRHKAPKSPAELTAARAIPSLWIYGVECTVCCGLEISIYVIREIKLLSGHNKGSEILNAADILQDLAKDGKNCCV